MDGLSSTTSNGTWIKLTKFHSRGFRTLVYTSNFEHEGKTEDVNSNGK